MTRFSLLRAVVAAISIASLPLAAGPAWAHAALVKAAPPVDATVSAPLPTQLTISFSEDIEIVFTHVTVTGANGAPVELGKPSLDPNDPKTVTVPITGALPSGTLKVEWDTVATDGHKSNGSYTLTIAP